MEKAEHGVAASTLQPVTSAESGQKLLRLLERRLALPANLLQRWIRTGQIRINGGRRKPFDPVKVGDVVRVPPFALALARTEPAARLAYSPECGLPPLLGVAGDIWALNKPAGLPAQSGSGHADSLAARLAACYEAFSFRPAPCHRLDMGTSGVILVGASFEALREVENFFRAGLVYKEYLAWVHGAWPWREDRLLRAWLRHEGAPGNVKMRVYAEAMPHAREAMTLARPARVLADSSLLRLRPFTGRRHQLRAQLASLGFPVIGDGKYGPKTGEKLLLHSMRVILPDGASFACAPPWRGDFAQDIIEEPLPDLAALLERRPNHTGFSHA